jgi:hypothetical protein
MRESRKPPSFIRKPRRLILRGFFVFGVFGIIGVIGVFGKFGVIGKFGIYIELPKAKLLKVLTFFLWKEYWIVFGFVNM